MRKILALLLVLFPLNVFAADINIIDRNSIIAVTIEGEIKAGDYENLKEKLAPYMTANHIVVFITGPGGDLLESMNIGGFIRDNKIKTVARGKCASACAYIWLAGIKLGVDPKTNLGFHAAYALDKRGRAFADGQGNALLGGYLAMLGYDLNLIAFATQVEGDSIVWMTANDARKLGLNFHTVKDKETFAKFLGIDK